MQSWENTVHFLGNNNVCAMWVKNYCRMSNFWCPKCDKFFSRTHNLEQNLSTSSEREKLLIPRKYIIQPKKLSLTSWNISELKTRIRRRFPKSYLNAIFIPSACKKKNWDTDTLRTIENFLQPRFPFPQTVWKNQFFPCNSNSLTL